MFKKIVVLLIVLGMLIVGIGCTCQYEGAYEKCVAQGGSLCLDMYPKCPNTK